MKTDGKNIYAVIMFRDQPSLKDFYLLGVYPSKGRAKAAAELEFEHRGSGKYLYQITSSKIGRGTDMPKYVTMKGKCDPWDREDFVRAWRKFKLDDRICVEPK